MSISLGQHVTLSGNVTTLQWIKPGYEAETEAALGFHRGRLAQGYWILVLKQLPRPDQFRFDGTTLNSGGRLGLPAATPAADLQRPKVHDHVLASRGAAGYADLQARTLRDIKLLGEQRIAKVLPGTDHNRHMAPSAQYPAGGGGLQWSILPPGLPFLAAAEVRANGTVALPGRVLDLATGDYAARATLRHYLTSA
ncbi:hypothetical protein [Tabrizicola sp.]|uniref:hypothetical protein n=1 Tax=Tabrizicola sp. TaxID=2005166 RepID=UPI0027367D6A|nr:hypothetical protein [Tabrizicola sp.]MDP3195447.1 hypothetical protein [Tabrizicola sp.]